MKQMSEEGAFPPILSASMVRRARICASLVDRVRGAIWSHHDYAAGAGYCMSRQSYS